MRKVIYTLLSAVFCLSFFSCADALNDEYPDQALSLAEEAGTTYTETSRIPYKNATVTGDFIDNSNENIWYFETYTNNCTFDISWESSMGKVSVSLSRYPDFRNYEGGFEKSTGGKNTVTIPGRMRVYIKVAPNTTYSSSANYILKVSGHAKKIKLTRVK